MELRTFDNVEVGQVLGPVGFPAIDRLTLALYCGASHDHNRIHIDPDVARASGLDDVIAHGMLSMAYVGRLITSWVGQSRVRKFSCRFVGMVKLGDTPVVSGEVVEKYRQAEQNLVRLALSLKEAGGLEKAQAEAVIALP